MIVKPNKAAEIAKYLSETLQESFQSNHFSIDINNIENNKRFEHYNFGWLSFNKKPVLLVELKSGALYQGSQIASDYRKMKKLYGGLLVVLLTAVDYEQRKTLTRNKVNFVVVGSQIHLPDIFISLREDKLKAIKLTKISPSTQLLIIYHLIKESLQDRRLREISAILGYSTKSITLSLQELIDFGVVELRQERDGKHLNFIFQGRELWNIISPHLTSPIKKELRGNISVIRGYLKGEKDYDMIVSGYDAGMHIINESSISFPQDIAISEETFKEWTNKGVKLHPTEGATRVEVWKYDPLKTAKRVIATVYCVDPLSLVLTYRDSGNKKLINYIPKIMQWVVWKG